MEQSPICYSKIAERGRKSGTNATGADGTQMNRTSTYRSKAVKERKAKRLDIYRQGWYGTGLLLTNPAFE